MYGFMQNPACIPAWRNRLAWASGSKTVTRLSHTTSVRSFRGAVASFVFINSTNRKEVNSHD